MTGAFAPRWLLRFSVMGLGSVFEFSTQHLLYRALLKALWKRIRKRLYHEALVSIPNVAPLKGVSNDGTTIPRKRIARNHASKTRESGFFYGSGQETENHAIPTISSKLFVITRALVVALEWPPKNQRISLIEDWSSAIIREIFNTVPARYVRGRGESPNQVCNEEDC